MIRKLVSVAVVAVSISWAGVDRAESASEVFGRQVIVSPRNVESLPFANTSSLKSEPQRKTALPADLGAGVLRSISVEAGIFEPAIPPGDCPPGQIACKPTPGQAEESNLRVISEADDVSSIVEVVSPELDAVDRVVQAFNSTGTFVATPNYWRRTNQTAEPATYLQWGFQSSATSSGGANFIEAWSRTIGSSDVNVAVIDTGVITQHPEFREALLPGIDTVGNTLLAGDGNGLDFDPSDPGDFVTTELSNYILNFGIRCDVAASSWHGTHVAGTIAARVNDQFGTGGAPAVSIIPIRVLGKCGGSDQEILLGLAWAIGIKFLGLPANPNPAHIINMSLGGLMPCTPNYVRLLNEAARRNIAVVVAAGNDNVNIQSVAPAGCPGVIAVAAHDSIGRRYQYSNYGAGVSISAPGVDVLSAGDSSRRSPFAPSMVQATGTSMAAPHVSAALALLKSAMPSLTPFDAKRLLMESAATFISGSSCASGEGYVNFCGAGYLDAGNLLRVANVGTDEVTSPPTTTPPPPPVTSAPPSLVSEEDDSACFVATAAFGSGWAKEVLILRKWRDQTLLQYRIGRHAVGLYYWASPPLADFIRTSDTRRAVARAILEPVVWAVQLTHTGLLFLISILVLIVVLPVSRGLYVIKSR